MIPQLGQQPQEVNLLHKPLSKQIKMKNTNIAVFHINRKINLLFTIYENAYQDILITSPLLSPSLIIYYQK